MGNVVDATKQISDNPKVYGTFAAINPVAYLGYTRIKSTYEFFRDLW